MSDAFNIDSPSPNGQHKAVLLFSGEVRFGPPYYVLSLDGRRFDPRIFGEAHMWSRSSGLLVVQEWLTLDYSEGPITALVVIDVDLMREAVIDRATKGFLVPETFDDAALAYRREYAGRSIEHVEIDAGAITDWKELV
jgi:hypothetical protein